MVKLLSNDHHFVDFDDRAGGRQRQSGYVPVIELIEFRNRMPIVALMVNKPNRDISSKNNICQQESVQVSY